MKPVEGAEAQAVLDAVAVGNAIPSGYALKDGAVYALEPEDEERIAAGGPIDPPPDASAINPGETPTTTTTSAP